MHSDKDQQTRRERARGQSRVQTDDRTRADDERARTTEGRPRADEEERRDDRSVGDLFKELAGESRSLLRQEFQLARTEITEKASRHRRSLAIIVAGAALVFAALAYLLVAVNRALTALLAQMMPLDVAAWLSPLALAVLFGLVGAGLARQGIEHMKREGMKPEKTVDSLKEDREWIEAEMS